MRLPHDTPVPVRDFVHTAPTGQASSGGGRAMLGGMVIPSWQLHIESLLYRLADRLEPIESGAWSELDVLPEGWVAIGPGEASAWRQELREAASWIRNSGWPAAPAASPDTPAGGLRSSRSRGAPGSTSDGGAGCPPRGRLPPG